MADLEKSLDARPVALSLPIGSELTFNGVIDVLAMKALIYPETTGKPREEALNAEQKERAETARTRLCEAVAETDDALLEKYLDKGVLEDSELRAALRAATLAGKLTPVLCGSGLKNIGVGPLLDAIDALLAGAERAAGSARVSAVPIASRSNAHRIRRRRFPPSSSRQLSIRSPASSRSFAWSRAAPSVTPRCSTRLAACASASGSFYGSRAKDSRQSPVRCRAR